MLDSIWCKQVLIAYRNNVVSFEGQKVSFLGDLKAPGFGVPSLWLFRVPFEQLNFNVSSQQGK